jgi:hypothetical protein
MTNPPTVVTVMACITGAPTTSEVTPMQWLEATPLMRALLRRRALEADFS